jgi:hypothetical protein
MRLSHEIRLDYAECAGAVLARSNYVEIGWDLWCTLPHFPPQGDYTEEAATTETSS